MTGVQTCALPICGYNTSSGIVTYSYTLNVGVNHGGGIVNDSFSIATTDIEGDIATGTLAINILDDGPIARSDVDEVINLPGNPSSVADGNVLTGVGGLDPNNADGIADSVGADSVVLPVTGVVAGNGTPLPANLGVATAGTYGSLTLNPDGSYSYVPTYANPVVSGLAPGATLTDTFTYAIQDSDGGSATTTLTLTDRKSVV